MKTDSPKTIYLKDYKPYPYALEHVDLSFQHPRGLLPRARENGLHRTGPPVRDLFLNGEHLELMEPKLDGVVTNDCKRTIRA
ncbi:MAG: hypothetical protein R3D66_03680 [Alphaproteobacteria bacterium]